MQNLYRRIKAGWWLGWALCLTLLRQLLGSLGLLKKRGGLARFTENYAADGIALFTQAERQQLAGFSRCIACGACDAGEAARIRASHGEYLGVMTLVLSSARNTADFGAASRSWRHVTEEVLEQKEQICPTRVPLRQIKRFVEERGSERSTVPATTR